MDMAITPILPGLSPNSDHTRDRVDGARLLSPVQAASPTFLVSWQALAANASEPNPFFEPWFTQPSFDQFVSDDSRALLAVYASGNLIGVLPIARGQSYYGYRVPHVSTWLHDNAFCGSPLVVNGFERVFWRGAFDMLDHAPGLALFLHLPQIPADGPLNAALDAVLAETGRKSATVQTKERAMLASDVSPDAYLANSMTGKKRKELRRQHKRLCEEGELTVDRSDHTDDITSWIGDFLDLESAGWKGDADSALASSADTRTFFIDALTGAAQAGRLERLTMRLDGRAIAMLVNFVVPPGVYSFKTTFDERFAKFSPGLLLQIKNLELLSRRGISWADSCASQGHSMIERIWREKRRMVNRNIAISGHVRRFAFGALTAYETKRPGHSAS